MFRFRSHLLVVYEHTQLYLIYGIVSFILCSRKGASVLMISLRISIDAYFSTREGFEVCIALSESLR